MKHVLRMVICLLLVITFRPVSVFGVTHSFNGTVGEVINYVNTASGSTNLQNTFDLGWLSNGAAVTVSLQVPDTLAYQVDGAWGYSGSLEWTISKDTYSLQSSAIFFTSHPYSTGSAFVWDDRVEDDYTFDRYTVNDVSMLSLDNYPESFSLFEVYMWDINGSYYNFDRTDSSIPFITPDPASLTPGADKIRDYCYYNPAVCSSSNIYDATFDLRQVITNDDGSTSYGSVFLVGINFDRGSDPIATPEPTTMFLLGLGLIGLAGVRRKFQK